MNTVITSKEEILKTSRKLIRQQGWSAINIRSVAAACGVSVGSIYNYFDSKAALVEATVKSVWREIFHRSDMAICLVLHKNVVKARNGRPQSDLPEKSCHRKVDSRRTPAPKQRAAGMAV